MMWFLEAEFPLLLIGSFLPFPECLRPPGPDVVVNTKEWGAGSSGLRLEEEAHKGAGDVSISEWR